MGIEKKMQKVRKYALDNPANSAEEITEENRFFHGELCIVCSVNTYHDGLVNEWGDVHSCWMISLTFRNYDKKSCKMANKIMARLLLPVGGGEIRYKHSQHEPMIFFAVKRLSDEEIEKIAGG